MSSTAAPLGRRERNKQEKLDRITAAATELFSAHGVDDVTTQQIADKADIGTGTLFLYAKTKGELLLLVQNSLYAVALERGRTAAASITDTADAVMAIVQPIVECNRTQIDNGRTYLREMAFGDPNEPHHAEALSIVGRTEQAYTELFLRASGGSLAEAQTKARILTSITFVTMAASINQHLTVDEILSEIRQQLGALLPH